MYYDTLSAMDTCIHYEKGDFMIATMNDTAAYKQLAEKLRQKITSGKIGADGRIGTETELARNNQLSRVTVRRAVDVLVNGRLLERRAGKGLYLRQADGEHPLNIWLVIDNFGRESFVHFSRAAQQNAKAYNFNILPKDGMAQMGENLRLLQEVAGNREVDGAIIVAWHSPEFVEAACEIKKSGKPFVLLDFHNLVTRFPTVVADNYLGGRLVAEHLYGLGHRNLAFIGDYTSVTVQKRLDGFRDFLAAKELVLPQDRILDVSRTADYFGDWQKLIDSKLEQLFALPKVPTALFASCDRIAQEVYRWCNEHGVGIPSKLSLVGFDNEPLSNILGLTTVSQPFAQMGTRAIRLLKDIVDGKTWDGKDVVLPVKLVVRKSAERLGVSS